MRHLAYAAAGLAAAVLATLAWALARIAMVLVALRAARSTGGLGAVSIDPQGGLVAAAVGFVAGWWWMWRRDRRHTGGPTTAP